MKQKYLITNLQETREVSIREYAELEKGEFAFVCEEIHDADSLKAAMPEGARNLVPIIRRPNMYPRQDFCDKIAQGIIDLLEDESGTVNLEIQIDDKDIFDVLDDDIDPSVVFEDDEDTKEDKTAVSNEL